jgi:hypothetical protein
VLALAESCPQLDELILDVCVDVGDVEITALARGCPALSMLSIQGTSVTEKGLRAIKEHCKSLQLIELDLEMFASGKLEAGFFPPEVDVGVH